MQGLFHIYIFLCFPAGYIQSLARYLKKEVWKQHWDTSCCYFSSKPGHISFPEGSSENHETPRSLQAPEMPCSCSFSKHGQCIHALVTRVSPCLAPEGWKVWCQALSLGQPCREAIQPEDSPPPSPQCALLALEPLLPSCQRLAHQRCSDIFICPGFKSPLSSPG